MNRQTRTVIVLAVAVVMAAVASFLVYRTVSRMPVQQVEVANYKVVVAAKPLGMGARLAETDLKLVSWPASSPVQGGHSDITAIVNRGLLSAVVENEPIVESKLAPIEAGAGLSPTIPSGMRAMSVRVNEVVGVAGFVIPGTKVDVLVTIKSGQRSQEPSTRTVASNIQVLTAGTRYDQDKAKDGQPIPSTVVTLMVTPSDAERIALAQSEGEVMLALRNPMDTDMTQTAGAEVRDLFGMPRQPVAPERPAPSQSVRPRRTAPAPAPAPPVFVPYQVESVKGGKRSVDELKEVARAGGSGDAKEVIK
jgi:pilus assembly protein CpaB